MIFFFVLLLNINQNLAQSTSGCGKTLGCFTFPPNCVDEQCTFIYKWIPSLNNKSHEFTIIGKIQENSLPESAWLAIGFSTDQFMGNDDVVLCKSTPVEKSIEHFFNSGQFTPSHLDPTNPSIGISDKKVISNLGYLVCTFTREKFLPKVQNYFNLENEFHILAATGQISPTGEITQHNLKLASSNPINFNTKLIAETKGDPGVKVKVHACFMIFAWMVLVSVAMAVARYFKFIFPGVLILDQKIWFLIHRPFVLAAFLLTLISFFVILADKNWTWIDKSNALSFVHSIFGILTIVFAFIQIFIAFFRPHPEHPNRYIFNHIHHFIGIITFLLAIIALYLGTSIPRVNLEARGIGFLIGWSIWIIFFVVATEFLERKYTNEIPNMTLNNLSQSFSGYGRENTNVVDENQIKLENLKIGLLSFHLLVTIGLSIGLMVITSQAKIF